jgi:hypothetical protein
MDMAPDSTTVRYKADELHAQIVGDLIRFREELTTKYGMRGYMVKELVPAQDGEEKSPLMAWCLDETERALRQHLQKKLYDDFNFTDYAHSR